MSPSLLALLSSGDDDNFCLCIVDLCAGFKVCWYPGVLVPQRAGLPLCYEAAAAMRRTHCLSHLAFASEQSLEYTLTVTDAFFFFFLGNLKTECLRLHCLRRTKHVNKLPHL